MRCDNSLATQALQDIRPHLTAMTYNKAHPVAQPQSRLVPSIASGSLVQVRTWAPTGTAQRRTHFHQTLCGAQWMPRSRLTARA